MNRLFILKLVILCSIVGACEDHEKSLPDSYVLNSKLNAEQHPTGFSFKEMRIISFPNSNNLNPDFMLSVHENDPGDILGPMLVDPVLTNRFIFRKKYDDQMSAQNYFDTLSLISDDSPQTFALDIKPYEIWQINTNTGQTGIILVLESQAASINNTPTAEIRFKAKILLP
jgi:hypothetical protein